MRTFLSSWQSDPGSIINPSAVAGTSVRTKGRRPLSRRQWPSVQVAAVYSLIVLGSGCGADPVDPSLSAADKLLRHEAETAGAVEADFVARALALAMKEPMVRFIVRDAMRESLFTEHKLVLQEFAVSEQGRPVINAAAHAVGLSPDSLKKVIGSIPLLDFYVPDVRHRTNWRGDESAFVAPAFGTDISTVTARGPDGARRVLTPAERRAAPVVFLLQPAERKSRRIRPQRAGPGASIQDPGDGQIGGTLVRYMPDGTTREIELADYFAQKPLFNESCDPNTAVTECLSEDGGANIPPPQTFLYHVIIIHVCDNGDCSQTNEFEWHTYFSSDSGATYGDRVDLRVEGVASNVEETWNLPAHHKKIQYLRDLITSNVIETDVISPDDNFDPNPTWGYFNPDGTLKHEGDLRCGYPKFYGGTYVCDADVTWREVNQSMRW